MPNLLVRNLDERLVKRLKARAARHARSTEAEHRLILEQALAPNRRSLAEVLASMPNVGEDQDFARLQTNGGRSVFD